MNSRPAHLHQHHALAVPLVLGLRAVPPPVCLDEQRGMVLLDAARVQACPPAAVGSLDGHRRPHRRQEAGACLPTPHRRLDARGCLGAPQAAGQGAGRHAARSRLDGEHRLAHGSKVLAGQVAAHVALDGCGRGVLHLHLALVQLSHLAGAQEHLQGREGRVENVWIATARLWMRNPAVGFRNMGACCTTAGCSMAYLELPLPTLVLPICQPSSPSTRRSTRCTKSRSSSCGLSVASCTGAAAEGRPSWV